MSEGKFTKGPWVAYYPHELLNSGHVSIEDEFGREIYTKSTSKRSLEENVSNAHLIACAPEMYEFIETYMGGHPEAEKLLTKARGEL